MAQYAERVDETVYAVQAVLVPGLRGRARKVLHYGDPLTEPPIGGILQINNGYNFDYIPKPVKSLTPVSDVVTVQKKGTPAPKPYRFKARPIEELSTGQCE